MCTIRRKLISTGIIIQARIDSSRYPGKALKPLMGMPAILHVIERCKQMKHCDVVILATTNRKLDDDLAEVSRGSGIELYRGNVRDVLDRYYQCAKSYGLTNVIRVTGDCPLIDIDISSKVIAIFLRGSYDYVRTGPTYPDGLNTEVFSFNSLMNAWINAKLYSEREHVTPYLWKNGDKFSTLSVESKIDLSRFNFALDYPEDLAFIRKLFEKLYHLNHMFGLDAILDLLGKNKDLLDEMPKPKRYEGYYRSLKQDLP